MIVRVDRIQKQCLGTIKSRRYKTMKTADKNPTGTYFTKVITLEKNQPIEWLEKQILSRADTLSNILQLNLYALQSDKLFQILLTECPSSKTLYLTRRYMPGFTLTEVISKKNQHADVFNFQNQRKLVWEIMGLIISGEGFNNIIVTNDNLIFEITGKNQYKPCLNYFSFAGYRLLKFGKNILREQYLEIAVFLDKQALQTGNIDRFEFKARNFAALLLSLVSQNNLYGHIFENVKLQLIVSLQTAIRFLEKYVEPMLKRILRYPTVQHKIQKLKIKGLAEFLEISFGQKQQNMDWASIQNSLLGSLPSQSQESRFIKVGKILWQYQDEQIKKRLLLKGLGMSQQKQGPNIYLAVKIGLCLEKLVQSNNWDDLFEKIGYNIWINKIYKRLMKISVSVMKMQLKDITTNMQNHLNQQQFKAKQQIIHIIRQLSQNLSFKTKIENRQGICFISEQNQIFSAYPG